MKLSPNVGGLDRTIRLSAGAVLILLALSGVLSGALAIAAYTIAAIALVTGFIRYCPANTLLGINTCEVKQPGSPK